MSPILQRATIGQEDDFIHAMLYSLMQSTKKTKHDVRLHGRLHDNGHSSYVVAQMETDALNQLYLPDGRRAFNAKHYSLHDLVEHDCISKLRAAMQWVKEQVDLRLSPLEKTPKEEQHRYGYQATRVDQKLDAHDKQNIAAPTAKASWTKWHDILTKFEVALVASSNHNIGETQIDVINEVRVTAPHLSHPSF